MQDERFNRGENGHGNNSRRRHAERGAEMSGGSWYVAGVVDIQVDGAPLQERRCREDVT